MMVIVSCSTKMFLDGLFVGLAVHLSVVGSVS